MRIRIVTAALLLAGAVMAQGPEMGGPGPHPMGFGPGAGPMGAGGRAANLDALKTAIGLTDAQVQQLKDLRSQQFQDMKPALDEIRAKAQELRAATQAQTPDAATVGKLTLELKSLRESMQSNRTALEAKTKALLTPDQIAKLKPLEDAQKLMPAIHEAMALGLLAPPDGAGAGNGAMAMARARSARKSARQ
jgi:Spy/CpxP family protein refolding chaperone